MQRDSNIKVYARVRPPMHTEITANATGGQSFSACLATDGCDVYATKDNTAAVVIDPQTNNVAASNQIKKFSLDAVFNEKSSQDTVFNTILPDMLDTWLGGVNCTLFAYGISASGKTFTMVGPEQNPGILSRVADYLFNHIENIAESNFNVVFTAVQLYREKIFNLLDFAKEVKFKVLPNSLEFGSSMEPREASDIQGIVKLFGIAQKFRVVASTQMNDASTRGHVIYTIKLTAQNKYTGKCTESKFNIVDLAGSERIKVSGVTGERLQESIKINLSLTTLVRVVESTARRDTNKKTTLPPYRESQLTLMLRDSLGGNCLTSMIITLSPALRYAADTIRTLEFGSLVKHIQNKPTTNVIENKFFNKGQYHHEPKAPNKPQELEPPWKGLNPKISRYLLNTQYGEISLIDNGADPKRNQLILLMHANPSYSDEFLHFFPSLTYYGYRVVAFDQPGFGYSPGNTHSHRSEKINDKGGPADIARAVADQLGFKTFIAGGYDWGAGVALALAQKDNKRVPKVLALLPSFNVTQDSEIKAIAANVLILWIKHDQMHNWSKWKVIGNKLPKKTIHVIEDRNTAQRSGGGNAYEAYSDRMMREVIKFLGFGDPMAPTVNLDHAPEVSAISTTGGQVTKNQMITLRNQADISKLAEMASENDQKERLLAEPSIKAIKELKASGRLNQCLAKKDKALLDMVRQLPEVSVSSIRENPSVFVDLGIWTSLPQSLSLMWGSPRYFEGRQVLASIPTNPEISSSEFLYYQPESKYVHASHRCNISGYDSEKNEFILKVKSSMTTETEIRAPAQDILLLNHDQEYGYDDSGKLFLEDGIRGNYSSPLVKAKIYEIAIALKDIIKQLDFEADFQDIIKLQRQAIQTIRRCINIISFSRGVDRERIGRSDDLGQLAVNGQGQCHGLSSTMSGYLLIFSSILGIDLQFRGGTSYGDKSGHVTNVSEKHQWLQVTLRPSMESFVCDLWYQDALNDENMLCVPIADAMTELSCPHAKLLIKNQIAEIQASDIDQNLMD